MFVDANGKLTSLRTLKSYHNGLPDAGKQHLDVEMPYFGRGRADLVIEPQWKILPNFPGVKIAPASCNSLADHRHSAVDDGVECSQFPALFCMLCTMQHSAGRYKDRERAMLRLQRERPSRRCDRRP